MTYDPSPSENIDQFVALPQLSEQSLAELLETDDSVLARAIRQVIRGTETTDNYAAFGNTA